MNPLVSRIIASWGWDSESAPAELAAELLEGFSEPVLIQLWYDTYSGENDILTVHGETREVAENEKERLKELPDGSWVDPDLYFQGDYLEWREIIRYQIFTNQLGYISPEDQASEGLREERRRFADASERISDSTWEKIVAASGSDMEKLCALAHFAKAAMSPAWVSDLPARLLNADGAYMCRMGVPASYAAEVVEGMGSFFPTKYDPELGKDYDTVQYPEACNRIVALYKENVPAAVAQKLVRTTATIEEVVEVCREGIPVEYLDSLFPAHVETAGQPRMFP